MTNPTGILTREHWTQVISLALLAGSMLATATYFIVAQNSNSVSSLRSDINTVAVADRDLIDKQWRIFQDTTSALGTRVTTLEAEQGENSRSMNRLSTSIDQQGATIRDLTTALTKLQGVLDAASRRR